MRFLVVLFLVMACLSTGSVKAEAPKTFVLVHGSWVGEWYWDPLVDLLRSNGHEAHAVSLTGHGQKASQNSAEISVADHVDDIVDLVLGNDLNDIYLVGHSYGGKPITGAWDKLGARVHHIVYVEAVSPLLRGRVAIPADKNALSFLLMRYPDLTDTGVLPVPHSMAINMRERAMPQSLLALYGEVLLEHDKFPATSKRSFVYASNSRVQSFRRAAAYYQHQGGWDIYEIDGRHDVVNTALDPLAVLLLSLK